MRLATIVIRDANWLPIPDAAISAPTGNAVSDANGRAMILLYPGEIVAVDAKGYRKTTSVVADSPRDIILLPDKLNIAGKPDKRSRKEWLLIPLTVGIGATLLAGMAEFAAINRIKRRNQRRTAAMAVGKLPLDEWQHQMAADLAILYTHMALLASPDTEKAMEAATGDASSRGVLLPPGWKFSMDRLYDFAADLAKGDTTNMIGRAEMYADSGHGVYEKVAAETLPETEGFRWQVRNILGDTDHSCDDCIRLTRKGWVAAGSIPPPGVGRRCRANCRCRQEFRRVHVASPVAVA